MYERFYDLNEKPFSLTPNPRFVFYSRQYREAEGQLLYGINNREGFMLVTGKPGTGKTTLSRDLIEKLDPNKTRSALIFNPFLSGLEMLATLLSEFGVDTPPDATRKTLLDRLNVYLLEQLALGNGCVAIFDEAQHLSTEFLEQIRVLSNLETDAEKLIQIVLVGQPELLEKIRTPQMTQLDQRVSIRCTLTDLDEQETSRYVQHRLNVAGGRGQVHFSDRAITEIFRASHGVPRLINLVCDRALLAGYAEQTRDIQPEHVRKAVAALRGEDAEVRANTAPPPGARAGAYRRAAIFGTIGLLAVGSVGMGWWAKRQPSDDVAFARAVTVEPASAREQALTAFTAAYPLSAHVDDALMRLSALELSAGERDSALAHLEALARRVPAGPEHARALGLMSVAQLAGGDTTAACQGLAAGIGTLAPGDSALGEQVARASSLCSARAIRAATDSAALAARRIARDAAPRSTARVASDSARRAPLDTIRTPGANPAAAKPAVKQHDTLALRPGSMP